MNKPTVNDWCKGRRYPLPKAFTLPGFVALLLTKDGAK